MIYNLMEPPFEVKAFEEMITKEAQRFFEWYISEIPNRMELLKQCFEISSKKSRDIFDYSVDSLKTIWEWYIPQVKTVHRTVEEIEEIVSKVPESLKESVRKDSQYKLSLETNVILMDVAIYFAEVFVKNNKEIKWGFVTKPKSSAFLNRPVLEGFPKKQVLFPIVVIGNLTSKVVDGEKNPNALYNIYYVWKRYIN